MTAFLHIVLKTVLEGGELRNNKGSGSFYMMQSSLISKYQDPCFFDSTVSVKHAILCKWFSGSRDTMPNKRSIAKCRSAFPGREPARKKTTGSGVLS